MKDKKVYAEIVSYGVSSHIAWFDSLKEARKALDEHISSMQKVGDYEIFRNEEADAVEMKEGDMSVTIYVPSGNDDEGDNDVEFVIIRTKKGGEQNAKR